MTKTVAKKKNAFNSDDEESDGFVSKKPQAVQPVVPVKKAAKKNAFDDEEESDEFMPAKKPHTIKPIV